MAHRFGLSHQRASWLVFYAIRDGYVKARVIAERTGLTRGSVTAALVRLRDTGAVASTGPNQSRTHACLTKRPPRDMTGKYPRPNAKRRPAPPDAGRLWEVWR